MTEPYTAVLLIAFGGPEKMEDVRPFLANVLRGRPVPPDRVDMVVRHYEVIGGRSRLNEFTFRQADALRAVLQARHSPLRVYVGMRNWHPYLRDTLTAMATDGVHRAIGFILAAQQNDAAWYRYQRDVEEARAAVGPGAPRVDYTGSWHNHPLFIEAVSDRLREALLRIPAARRAACRVVFTAHSIPVAMADDSPYVSQLSEGAALVAARLDLPRYALAYQSRSGNPREPWLGPDILETIRAEADAGTRDMVAVPIGFVCDHVEVAYDLAIEARDHAAALGINFETAETANDHPAFIRMIAEVICSHVAQD